jgi:pimeloyl-ACP methyl ester carboxylesterase
MPEEARLFVPGWGAPAGFYRRGLPEKWEGLELPTFTATHGHIDAYRSFVRNRIVRTNGRVTLAGHSMGGALAILAAADEPERIEKLILLSPSGLPISKSLPAIAITFGGQIVRGRFPTRELCHAVANIAVAPDAALRLARELHELDLTPELERLSAGTTTCTVIASTKDRLTTPEHCRQLAALLNATYRELDTRDGHIWPITEPERLKAELTTAGSDDVERRDEGW